jgi:hypothetical protein
MIRSLERALISCQLIKEQKMAKDEFKETVDEIKKEIKKEKCHSHNHHGWWGGSYFLMFIGAAVYYIQQSDTFWMGVLGFLKAIVWPAMLIYKVFTLLHM